MIDDATRDFRAENCAASPQLLVPFSLRDAVLRIVGRNIPQAESRDRPSALDRKNEEQ